MVGRPAAKLASAHLQEPLAELAQLPKEIGACFSPIPDAVEEPLGEMLCEQAHKPGHHADAKREKLIHLSLCSD
jgi:hypothetical protein